ncbi:PTS mannose transporter subunit IID [Terrilactibacillus sp. BCM23-1]|uniref:PTS mannose transporter subunit IID n=1 Tax=Terrilactibacillus tamarindi TaxID=2599694 RepID=A0A6N8CR79_9BACI|nr:PTS sugar transporter subunit IIA [Terrilactibacillus tamarindi]MTT32551.1 PTS mannose transporter subunit IID [Terrilactibacillus tamarindi]
MIALIVATHGEFSREIVKSAEMIFGKQDNLETITFLPGEGIEELKEKYLLAMKHLDTSKGVLFMTDLFGGSPFNVAASVVLDHEEMEVITGTNLPMLVECFARRRTDDLKTLVPAISQTAIEGVKTLSGSLSLNEEEGDL